MDERPEQSPLAMHESTWGLCPGRVPQRKARRARRLPVSGVHVHGRSLQISGLGHLRPQRRKGSPAARVPKCNGPFAGRHPPLSPSKPRRMSSTPDVSFIFELGPGLSLKAIDGQPPHCRAIPLSPCWGAILGCTGSFNGVQKMPIANRKCIASTLASHTARLPSVSCRPASPFCARCKSLQIDGGEMPETLEAFVGLIHPEDRQIVQHRPAPSLFLPEIQNHAIGTEWGEW